MAVAASPAAATPAPAASSSSSAQTKQQPIQLHEDISKVIYGPDEIERCLERLGKEIGAHYKGRPVLALGVLKGGFMFTADLVRHVHPVPPKLEVDFIKASSYGSGTVTSGTVKLDDGFNLASVAGKHVLVVEDIVDSGLTLSRIVSLLTNEGKAASVKVCTLLDKRARRKVVFEADWVGFECPDEFVVGYGIDFSEHYRFLPYIGVPTDAAIERVREEARTTTSSQDTP